MSNRLGHVLAVLTIKTAASSILFLKCYRSVAAATLFILLDTAKKFSSSSVVSCCASGTGTLKAANELWIASAEWIWRLREFNTRGSLILCTPMLVIIHIHSMYRGAKIAIIVGDSGSNMEPPVPAFRTSLARMPADRVWCAHKIAYAWAQLINMRPIELPRSHQLLN